LFRLDVNFHIFIQRQVVSTSKTEIRLIIAVIKTILSIMAVGIMA
jgi:hypothetical protein